MTSIIKIGCCGYGKGGLKKYALTFNVVEVQSTFYNLPKIETVKKWSNEALSINANFEFTIKAWQGISHSPNSPTWRRSRVKPDSTMGSLKPTEKNFSSWKEITNIAKALKSKFIIIQTPPSFSPSEINIKNMKDFFSSINRDDIIIGWEPRGEWRTQPTTIMKLCEELNLVHVVDPFRMMPLSNLPYVYFRLHGIGGTEYNYRYKYSDDDLVRLIMIINEQISRNKSEIYVMFNNFEMVNDAQRLLLMIEKQKL
ncbi:MAG: DUF72 domain-containing protein [Thermoprotei archaeon]